MSQRGTDPDTVLIAVSSARQFAHIYNLYYVEDALQSCRAAPSWGQVQLVSF